MTNYKDMKKNPKGNQVHWTKPLLIENKLSWI